MKYPDMTSLKKKLHDLDLYLQLKTEYGSRGLQAIVKKVDKALANAIRDTKKTANNSALAKHEPNDLKTIQALRPAGPRKIWSEFQEKDYRSRLEGAFLGRMAGCTLGAPVENWQIKGMRDLAEETGVPFPPTDYWTYVPVPKDKRYNMSRREDYTRDKMNGVPVDDDIVYTILGLLIVEEYGPSFTTADVGKAWLKYLDVACTAEEVALNNLRKGISADLAGEIDNPFCEWIGADIRSDPWGYVAPGLPEKAAVMAYRDAYLSHRRQGIFGEMYFSAAIAAAFTVKDPVEALEIGLTEIPRQCALAKAIRWALAEAPRIRDYKQARAAVDRRFAGMHPVHTINNACLTIWGITIGGTDFTRVISETVAMGLDNDCTAATAGSIVGAVVGRQGIPRHWYKNFNNTVLSYIIGKKRFRIDDLLRRFTRQAKNVWQQESAQ